MGDHPHFACWAVFGGNDVPLYPPDGMIFHLALQIRGVDAAAPVVKGIDGPAVSFFLINCQPLIDPIQVRQALRHVNHPVKVLRPSQIKAC
jgi:hypothetical protein